LSLGDKFSEAMGDRQLMQLRSDVALIDAMLTSYTGSLKDTGRPLPMKAQQRVMALLEQRRKHIESEAKRLRDLAQVVPVDQYRTALSVLAKLIGEYLADNPEAMRELHRSAQRLLMGRGVPVKAGDE
jgi:hypothetical protein